MVVVLVTLGYVLIVFVMSVCELMLLMKTFANQVASRFRVLYSNVDSEKYVNDKLCLLERSVSVMT